MMETEKAWLAAVIDCEGSISVAREQQVKAKRGYSYRPLVQINNTKRELVARVQEITGVGAINRVSHQDHASWNDIYRWNANSNAIRKFLPEIVPYLLLKKRQAERTLQILSCLNSGYRGPYEPEIEKLFLEIRELNRRGKSHA